LVNLADTEVSVGEVEQRVLAPHSYVNISAGEKVSLGDFNIIFHLGAVFTRESGEGGRVVRGGGRAVGLAVSLPQTRLTRHQPLEGVITVRNQGDKAGVQFKLELDGLPPDSYEMEPGPILFAGAEKSILLQIYPSKKSRLRAGDYQFSIHATASEYPGEGVMSAQAIQVLPFYQHSLHLMPLGQGDET
jgi:hypothetical protein